MKKLTLALMAGAALTFGAGAASAQAWMPMIEREALVDARITAGLAAGDLTPVEARRLRADMAALVGLEARYRFGGLSARERLDLDRRYAALHDRVELAMADADPVTLASFEDRKLRLERRIEQGVESGQLTALEAEDLGADLAALERVEARYRRDGVVTASERADLERRLDLTATEFAAARTDADRVYGWSRY